MLWSYYIYLVCCLWLQLRNGVFLWWMAQKNDVLEQNKNIRFQIAYFFHQTAVFRVHINMTFDLDCQKSVQVKICALTSLRWDIGGFECFSCHMFWSEGPHGRLLLRTGPFAAVRLCLFSFVLEWSCELILLDSELHRRQKQPNAKGLPVLLDISLWDENIRGN